MAYIIKIISTAMKKKKREKGGKGEKDKRDGRRRGRGWNRMQEEEKREREWKGNRRKHMAWRLVPRRSKAYLASSCSCLTARGTAAGQTALPGTPFFLRSPMRLVASRFSTYEARGAPPEGPCVFKTSRRPQAPSLRRVRVPSEVFPPKTPLPIATYEVPVERWLDASRGRGWDALRTWTLLS